MNISIYTEIGVVVFIVTAVIITLIRKRHKNED